MLKKKTHKATQKRVKLRPDGTSVIYYQGSRHNTGKKSSKVNRKNRKGKSLSKADEKRVKNMIN